MICCRDMVEGLMSPEEELANRAGHDCPLVQIWQHAPQRIGLQGRQSITCSSIRVCMLDKEWKAGKSTGFYGASSSCPYKEAQQLGRLISVTEGRMATRPRGTYIGESRHTCSAKRDDTARRLAAVGKDAARKRVSKDGALLRRHSDAVLQTRVGRLSVVANVCGERPCNEAMVSDS